MRHGRGAWSLAPRGYTSPSRSWRSIRGAGRARLKPRQLRIFDLPTFAHLDGQPSSVTRSFCSFLAAVPTSFQAVQTLRVTGEAIELDGLSLPTGPLFV